MIVTKENIQEALENREVRDILVKYKHPNEFRNENGFTFLDYALWRCKNRRWSANQLVIMINKKLRKENYESIT